MAKHCAEAKGIREVQRGPTLRRDGAGGRVQRAVYTGRGGQAKMEKFNIPVAAPSSSSFSHIVSQTLPHPTSWFPKSPFCTVPCRVF